MLRAQLQLRSHAPRLAASRAHVRTRAAEGAYARGGTLLLRDASGQVTTNYDDVVTETVGDLKLRFLARDFFQNNPFILPAFTGYAREQAAATGARFLVDAYCGSGLFALACAPAFEKVAGIEISESSIVFARQNAEANRLANVTFQAGDAAAIFAGLAFPAADTVVLIDPPRKGCDEAFLAQLFAYGPRAVVYVSCDPATQMRDLRAFTAAGYALTAVQPFDLFPQTRHLECVVTLRKNQRASVHSPEAYCSESASCSPSANSGHGVASASAPSAAAKPATNVSAKTSQSRTPAAAGRQIEPWNNRPSLLRFCAAPAILAPVAGSTTS